MKKWMLYTVGGLVVVYFGLNYLAPDVLHGLTNAALGSFVDLLRGLIPGGEVH